MNINQQMIGLTSLLTVGAIAGLAMVNHAQPTAPSLPPGVSQEEHNLHHPEQSPAPTVPQKQSVQIDQHFIEMMIPHHQEAIAMADLALTRAKRPEIKKLAQAIQRDQAREIKQMRTWYKQWYGKEVPATPMMMGMMDGQGMMHCNDMMGNGMMMNGQAMMGNGSIMNHQAMMGNGGMMSMTDMQGMRTDLKALKAAKDFDREFIRQMVPHHRMAVMMAQMLQQRTTRLELKTLAQAMIKTQTAELNQMQQWERAWFQ